MSAIDWLRDIGKHFSVNRMLAKEAVAARLEAGGISYTEFSYQVCRRSTSSSCTGVTADPPARRAATSGGTSRRASTSSAAWRVSRPRARDAADHEAGRREVRQEHRLDALARPGADDAVRVLPVVRQHR